MTDLSSIPQHLLSILKTNIKDGINIVENQRKNLWGHENNITGALLTRIATPGWIQTKDSKFRITYNAPTISNGMAEQKTGADGLIQIEVYDKSHHKLIESKCMVFQAKKSNNKEGLQDQINNMCKITGFQNNGSAVIIYDMESGFSGEPAEQFDISKLKLKYKSKPLSDLIADDFLDCKIGVYGIHFNIDDQEFLEIAPRVLNIEIEK